MGDLTAKVVADIGCGNGTYLRALSEAGAVALGLDLSAGMLRAVPDGHGDLALADAQSLPLRTGCADAAIAMHRLYHVPDPALAVREARRVLRPGGRFIAAIGGPAHLAEARQSWSSLLRDAGLGPELQDLGLTNTRFSVPRLEELLRENFPEVRLSMLTSHVVLTSAAPLAKFAASTTVAKLAAAQGAGMNKSFVGP